MTYWFLSDLHLGHTRVAEDRGFTLTPEHDLAVLNSIADTTKREGVLYLLGDIWWGHFIKNHLNYFPKQVHLIYGNHDDLLRKENIFTSQQEMKYIKIEGQKIHLCHYPMASWRSSPYGSWHLHGHTHGRCPQQRNRLDVSWEVIKRPFSFEEVRELLICSF